MNNRDRAIRADVALEAWRMAANDVTDESNIRDLISDLLHLVEMRNDPEHTPQSGTLDPIEKARDQHRIAWDNYEADREEER